MKYILLSMLLLLGGCALLPTRYDGTEYGMIVEIREFADNAKQTCGDPQASLEASKTLYKLTKHFTVYEEYIPNNDSVFGASKSLHAMSEGLSKVYAKQSSISEPYCYFKFGNISRSAALIQYSVGGRPR